VDRGRYEREHDDAVGRADEHGDATLKSVAARQSRARTGSLERLIRKAPHHLTIHLSCGAFVGAIAGLYQRRVRTGYQVITRLSKR
jgi:hypothetical protein